MEPFKVINGRWSVSEEYAVRFDPHMGRALSGKISTQEVIPAKYSTPEQRKALKMYNHTFKMKWQNQ